MTYDVLNFKELIPGDVGFTKISGVAGAGVTLGQAIIGDANRYSHVMIALGAGMIFEARPRFARIYPVTASKDSLWYRLPLADTQRDFIVSDGLDAFADNEIKYSWGAYINLALLQLNFRSEFVTRRLGRSRARICSQAVDERLMRAGYHVFDDGRKMYEVTPGDMEWRFAHDPTVVPFRIDNKPSYWWHK